MLRLIRRVLRTVKLRRALNAIVTAAGTLVAQAFYLQGATVYVLSRLVTGGLRCGYFLNRHPSGLPLFPSAADVQTTASIRVIQAVWRAYSKRAPANHVQTRHDRNEKAAQNKVRRERKRRREKLATSYPLVSLFADASCDRYSMIRSLSKFSRIDQAFSSIRDQSCC
jgi:hypothetical protein